MPIRYLENAGADVELLNQGIELVALGFEEGARLLVQGRVVRVVRAHPARLVQGLSLIPNKSVIMGVRVFKPPSAFC